MLSSGYEGAKEFRVSIFPMYSLRKGEPFGATWSILEFPTVSQQMVCERILRSCHHDYEDSCRNEILAPSGRKGPFGGQGQFQREQIDGTAAKLSIGFDRFWDHGSSGPSQE